MATDSPSSSFGAQPPMVRSRPPGAASRSLASRLRAVESRNVTHLGKGWPVFWEEARGANVRDADGNVYVDLTAAFGVALLGHAHPGVVKAVRAQAERLVHGMGDVHPPTVKLALLERLTALAPWEHARAVLAGGGSEAVEVALKTTHLATGRPGILAFEGGYHGLTLGALAATARDHFRAPFARRLYDGVAFAPFPDVLRDGPDAGARALDRVRTLLEEGAPNGDAIGTVIVEPVQGRGGGRVAPDGFMAALSAAARDAGALVVADEVFTGMGRCGALLASERVGLEPDVLCLGKALGGGLPLSACVASAEVMDAWPESDGEAVHTSTFLGHPLACAAGVAVLDALEEEAVVERARVMGAKLAKRLRAALSGLPGVAEVRGLGLLLGVELVREGGLEPAVGRASRVAEAALREGVMVLPAGDRAQVLEITPSVDLTEEQADAAVAVLARALRETP